MASKNLNEALLAAQKAMPELQKNAINPHFKNRYISLDSLMEQVLPILNEFDLILVQAPTALGDDPVPALATMLIHAPTGEQLGETMLLSLDKDTPQGQGSAITYARRYSLMAMLGLVADEDDDANAASAAKPVRRLRSVPPTGDEYPEKLERAIL